MLIVSKHRDFYDGVVGTMGIDKTLVYNRETIIIEKEKEFPKEFQRQGYTNHNKFLDFSKPTLINKDKYVECNTFIIGFCGKLYCGWKLYERVSQFNDFSNADHVDITYNYDYAKEYLKPNYWKTNLNDTVNYINNYNNINIFRTLGTPIFVLNLNSRQVKDTFIINPILTEYKFYKIFDSFLAFQEIQMFLGGVLGSGEKEIIEVHDKYKIGKYGFDKWSFRKESSKNK